MLAGGRIRRRPIRVKRPAAARIPQTHAFKTPQLKAQTGAGNPAMREN
jgi:hypothetical protein